MRKEMWTSFAPDTEMPTSDGRKPIYLSDKEIEAITDFLPRVQVTNVCREGDALHTALLKIAPHCLPTSLRRDL